jgi:hypothetical protein
MSEKRIPTGEVYEIDSFQKMLNVANKDNFEDLTNCFFKYMMFHVLMKDECKDLEDLTLSGFDAYILGNGFIWTDDGETRMDVLRVKDPDTGKITEITYSEKDKQKNGDNK